MKRGKKAICVLAFFLWPLALTGCGGQRAADSGSQAAAPAVADGSAGQADAVWMDRVSGPAAGTADGEYAAAAPSTEGAGEKTEPAVSGGEEGGGIDVDLTAMSRTMVYAEVSNMMYLPEEYVGKRVRMQGQCFSAYYDVTDTTYYSVFISDAAACCAQGIEYVLADGGPYPDDDMGVTVTGVFELYEEMGITYCRLADAVVEI